MESTVAELTPRAAAALIELDAVPHFLLLTEADREKQSANALPDECAKHSIETVYTTNALQQRHTAETPLVLSNEGESLAQSTGKFTNVYRVAGGADELLLMLRRNDAHLHASVSANPRLAISKHAVYVLLNQHNTSNENQLLDVFDIRRSDERELYGSIPGTRHVACEDVPKLVCTFPDTCVLHCRTQRRSGWASLVLREYGKANALVMPEGVYGWNFNPANVKPYPSYEQFHEPPAAVAEVPSDHPDVEAGKQELDALKQSLFHR